MSRSNVEVLRSAWDAFTNGDIERATAVLDENVRWHPTGEPHGDGACHNREHAAAFIRQSLADGVSAELLAVRDAGDRLVAVVHTHAPPDWEQSPQPHGELVTILDGKVTEIVVYPTVDAAPRRGWRHNRQLSGAPAQHPGGVSPRAASDHGSRRQRSWSPPASSLGPAA